MNNMRVYEAARKLNMQAGELVKILEQRGISASPISSIDEETFNSILESMVSAGEPPREPELGAPLKLVSSKDKADHLPEEEPEEEQEEEPTTAEEVETEKQVIALAPDTDSVEEREEQPEPGEEQEEPVMEAAEPEAKEESEAPEQKPQPAEERAKAEPTPALAPGVAGKPPRARPSLVSYAAFTLALLMGVGLMYVNTNVKLQAAQISTLHGVVDSAQGSIDQINIANELQGELISQNRAGLADLAKSANDQKRMDARNELSSSASALEEMAAALAPNDAVKIRSLASQLAELGSSL